MSQTQHSPQECDRFLRRLDSGVEGPELLEHPKICPDCARELAARQGLRLRMKTAVHSVEVPPFLEARIRNSLQTTPRRSWMRSLVPAAATLGVFLVMGIAYQLANLRMTTERQEAYIRSVSLQVGTLMRVGLGNHIHCAVFRKYPKEVHPVSHFIQDLGSKYSELLPVVQKYVPKEYTLREAHQCRYHGRRFVHFAAKDESKILSLVIVRKNEGESFQTEGLLPALVQSGLPVYQSGVEHFQISSFESDQYMVYFISDLSRERNTEILTAMAPVVKAFLDRS